MRLAPQKAVFAARKACQPDDDLTTDARIQLKAGRVASKLAWPMNSLPANALGLLQKVYGYPEFRGQQAEIIDHVVAGRDAFVLMPTGGGKSLCYQIPALLRPGVGVVISPLIALMQDQVDALTQLGIRAAAINSAMAPGDIARAKRGIRDGTLDLVYVAPERLLMDEFLALLHASQIALFAIDEAHCVSQWGHDFRPHYTQLTALAEQFPHVPRIALTATADQPTRKDIVERLHLAEGRTFVSGFDRPNIRYAIVEKNEPRPQILRFIREAHPRDSGIVYCLSRKLVEETAEWLCAQGCTALAYHAGMAAEDRARNQERFLRDENTIMVATIAFGMGIDKPDVRFVIHLNLPKNIEAYYQETGRAGRDGLPADALLLYSMADAVQLRRFIDDSDAPEAQKRIEHRKMNSLLGLCEAAACRRQILLEYFGDRSPPCGNCDTCLEPPVTFDATVAAQKAISCAYRTDERFGVGYLVDVLLGDADERMTSFGHDKISTFGIGRDLARAEWQGIFRQLIALHLLTPDGEFGSLKITPQGVAFLKNKEPLHLRRHTPKPKSKRRDRERTAALPATEAGADIDHALFAAMKAKRLELARAQSVPPYVIFHDRVLLELAARKPATLAAMGQISGVGQSKLEHYGKTFLAVVSAHETNQLLAEAGSDLPPD
jgi:ATP-dependent DNA helicase RecQ